jgi:hypothetical protein
MLQASQSCQGEEHSVREGEVAGVVHSDATTIATYVSDWLSAWSQPSYGRYYWQGPAICEGDVGSERLGQSGDSRGNHR